MNIFGNKYKINKVKAGKDAEYEVYQRIFFGLYKLIGTFNYKDGRKFMEDHNIELEFKENE